MAFSTVSIQMSKAKGFNLIELMIVLTIIGIFLGFAVPSYQAAVQNTAREEAAMGLVNALALARSEAIARGVDISVVPNLAADNPAGTGSYDGGVWSVRVQGGGPAFPGDPSPVIDVFQVSIVDRVTSGGVPFNAPFVFSPNGTVNQAATVNFCFDNGASCNQVRVNLVGRTQMAVVGNP